MELNHATLDHTRLPDLTNVLFKETYDEYTHNRDPVVLTSHCWSSQQTLYVGCRGGQLLMVDFDTGVIQVLANTQLTQVFLPCMVYMYMGSHMHYVYIHCDFILDS